MVFEEIIMLRTVEEFLKYGQVPEGLAELLSGEVDEKIRLEKEIKSLRKDNELAWEAVSFARDNFEALECRLRQCTSGKQARAAYSEVMENGYFEM